MIEKPLCPFPIVFISLFPGFTLNSRQIFQQEIFLHKNRVCINRRFLFSYKKWSVNTRLIIVDFFAYFAPPVDTWVPLPLQGKLISGLGKILVALSNCKLKSCIYFIDFLRRECRFFVQTSPLHLTTSVMRLYTCLMDEISAQATAEGSDRMSGTQVYSTSFPVPSL